MITENGGKDVIVEAYTNSVDENVFAFVKDAISNAATKKYVIVAEITDEMAEEVLSLTGKSIRGKELYYIRIYYKGMKKAAIQSLIDAVAPRLRPKRSWI